MPPVLLPHFVDVQHLQPQQHVNETPTTTIAAARLLSPRKIFPPKQANTNANPNSFGNLINLMGDEDEEDEDFEGDDEEDEEEELSDETVV